MLVQTAFLGDLLLSIPLLRKIKQLWPGEPVGLLCRQGLGDFFRHLGLVDQVFEIRKGDSSSYRAARKAILAQGPWARIISPHTSLRTAFFVRSLGVPERISFQKGWNFPFFTERQRVDPQWPDALRQLSLVSSKDKVLEENLRQYALSRRAYARAEGGRLSPAPTWASMGLRETLRADVETWQKLLRRWPWLESGTPRVALFPGSVWATKKWTEEGFEQVGRELVREGFDVLIMGGPGEEDICSRLAMKIPGARPLGGLTSIWESALILSRADLTITNDSASAHLSCVSETACLAIFGPTTIEFGFRPWGSKVAVAEKEGLFCRPCGPHGHRRCPRGTHECMKNLAPVDVLERARSLISEAFTPR